MANLSKDLLALEAHYGEVIEAIVVGRHDKRRYDDKAVRADENVVLTRDAGLAKLDEDYDNGYGGADCYPFYAWTPSRVFFVTEHDGATGIAHAPRHPTALEPEFSGQTVY